MNTNEKHNESLNRKRDYIHSRGTPIFSKYPISEGYNCTGCRKHFKTGPRWRVTYKYQKDENNRYGYERTLGKVCSETCYTMLVLRFS